MVAEDIASGAATMSDISLPSSAITDMEAFNQRLHPESIDINSMYRAFAEGSGEGSIVDSNHQAITDTKHFSMISQMKKTMKRLRDDSAKGNNGDPDPEAITQLHQMLQNMRSAVSPRSSKYGDLTAATTAVESAMQLVQNTIGSNNPVSADTMSQVRKEVNKAVSSNYLKNL